MINDIHDRVSLMGYIHLYNLHLNLISLECYFSDVGKNSPAYYHSSLAASNISHDSVQYIENGVNSGCYLCLSALSSSLQVVSTLAA